MAAVYDHKFDGYDREQCSACGEWMPWPALDDHEGCEGPTPTAADLADFDEVASAFYGEDDGPAGDYLADYWFNAEGPDEPPGL